MPARELSAEDRGEKCAFADMRAVVHMRGIVRGAVSAENWHATKGGFGRTNGALGDANIEFVGIVGRHPDQGSSYGLQ